uniref:Prolamin-like domain-containing protein n=1 Tax=Solanum tuberosum TaxID=4113 RepID=M1ASC9_SOLTU
MAAMLVFISGALTSGRACCHDNPVVQPLKPHRHLYHTSITTPDGLFLKGLSQKTKDFVDNCTNNISQPCGPEIVTTLFKYKNITSNCCNELVQSGLECHATLVKLLIRLPQYEKESKSILANSIKVFDSCVDTILKKILSEKLV